ncbi:hypothetical protein AX16_008794 [Volvariella volvacea WC 439]|nr:hypothetical protein AX16_008794 [Volvariella volvacea WC 439]
MSTSSDWIRVAPATCPPYHIYRHPIQKSEQDDRSYQVIKLENGLEATLIHDSNTDKAAASLDVAVGHLSDPDDIPGLAHFCEHLLFMGTESFPKENEYSEYLAKNNGSSNAYTSTTNTNYYFNVSTDGFRGALERFSAFFHCPLFDPSCTSRELNAVESEHKKNHQSDLWRMFQLNKHLSRPGHVWSKFGSGSRESITQAARALKAKGLLSNASNGAPKQLLGAPASADPSRAASPAPSVVSTNSEAEPDGGVVGRETRRRLVEWWSEEYCARRMRLCVIGKEPLQELAEIVSVLFSPIQDRGKEPLPAIRGHPFSPDEKNTLIAGQTVMDFRCMEMSFPLEYQAANWQYKPANLLSHFIGHEGAGSLYQYLKGKGWITELIAGTQNLAREFAMFRIQLHLTETGFANYQEILLIVFKYLSLLRAFNFEAYHQHELASLSAIQFRFAEKRRPDNYAMWITEMMAWPLPRHSLLSGPHLIRDWDNSEESQLARRKVTEYLESFRIQNCRVLLMAKEDQLSKVGIGGEWQVEPWYGVKYRTSKFDGAFTDMAEAPNDIPDLFLPRPNEFIPENLHVERKDIAQPNKRPHLIRQTPLSMLWHKKDDQFWVPKAYFVADVRSLITNSSPRASVLTRLYLDLVTDSLSELSYAASLAGLGYNLAPQPSGFILSVHGYNDKLEALVRAVQEKIRSLVVQPDRFVVFKEQAMQDWKNFFMGQSYSLSEFYGRYALADRHWLVEEKLDELGSITPEELQEHIKALLSQVNMRILAIGNIYKDEAIRLAEMMETDLKPSTLSVVEHNDRSILLPEGCNFTWASPVQNPQQANSALSYYLHLGSVVDPYPRVVSALLARIMSEPAFNILRTKEQLGYIVQLGPWASQDNAEKGIRLLVQSEKNPGYLEERVEAFLYEMKQIIESMEPEEFENHKTSLRQRYLETDKNLSDEVNRYFAHINSGQLDFLRRYNDAALLKEITKDNVLELFNSRVDASSPLRTKLSIHIRSIKPRPRGMTREAAEAYEAYLRDKLTSIDPSVWDNSPIREDNLSLRDFATYWKDVLTNEPEVEKLLGALASFIEKYPVPGEGEDRIPSAATMIEDLKTFKSGLAHGPNRGPLVQWDDLPQSKF